MGYEKEKNSASHTKLGVLGNVAHFKSIIINFIITEGWSKKGERGDVGARMLGGHL